MLKKVLIAVVVLIAGFLGFVATRPETYHVERSAVVNAPPEVVFSEVNSLENGFTKWSPWEKRDPNLKRTFSGPKEGVGAKYAWVGNKDVGSGNMTITESKQNEMVKNQLEFVEPFPSKAMITMSLAKEGAGTKVTWAMDGDNGFGGKLMSVFSSMDKMIGPDFESGLSNLQKVAQEDAAKAAAAPPPAPTPVTEGATPPPAGEPPPPPGTPPPPAPAGAKG